MLQKILTTYNMASNILKESLNNNYSVFKEDFLAEDEIKKSLVRYQNSYFYDFFIDKFNPEIYNFENLPKNGALIVGNHSFPGWDGLSVLHCLFHKYNRVTYSLAFKNMSSTNWISWLKSIGIVEGSPKVANELLSQDKLVQVYPGGIEDALKTFKFRYKVRPIGGFAKGRYGYLKVAQDSGKPIIPIGIVGADEAHYILTHLQSIVHPIMNQIQKSKFINEKSWFKNLAKGVLDCKVVPLPLNLIPLNKKIELFFGEPIKIKEKANLENLNDIVMKEIQRLIDYGLDERLRNS